MIKSWEELLCAAKTSCCVAKKKKAVTATHLTPIIEATERTMGRGLFFEEEPITLTPINSRRMTHLQFLTTEYER